MKLVACVAFLALTLTAQTAKFEAASIKLNTPGGNRSGINVQPARIRMVNVSLKFCVQVAWNVKDFQVSGGPGWADTERFDIDAVAEKPFEKDSYRAMLKELLAERFGVAVHQDTQEKQGYALVVAKNGPKLPPPTDDPSVMFSRNASGSRTLNAPNVSMKRFADALSVPLNAIVVDRTGVEGQFNVSFEWASDPSATPLVSKSGELVPSPPADASAGPSIFTALQEKLGLKLEGRKVPVEVIIIDRANKPTEN